MAKRAFLQPMLLLVVASTGCGSAPAAPVAPQPSSRTAASADTAAPADAPASPPEATSSAAPAKPGAPRSAPWNDSGPPGVEPLTADERAELEKKCGAFTKAVSNKAPKKVSGRAAAVEVLLQVLRDPPKVKGADSERCATLMRRDLIDYKARLIETDAVAGLKTALVMLEHALSGDGKLCPPAGPLPADFEQLRRGPYQPTAKELEPWKCLGGPPGGGAPLRAQYAVVTDPAGGKFRLSARTASGTGGDITELFIEGKVQGKKIDKEAQVMRLLP